MSKMDEKEFMIYGEGFSKISPTLINAILSLTTPISNLSIGINFNSTDDEAKGLKTLLDNGCDVHYFDDGAYGVASLEQIKLLDNNGIQYQRIYGEDRV